MTWFSILKEESLEEKQKRRRDMLNELRRTYDYNQWSLAGFPAFKFYGALEIFSMMGKKFEREALRQLTNIFNTRHYTLLRYIEKEELKEKPIIQFNPILSGSGRPNFGGQVIYTFSFAGPNVEIGSGIIDIPIKEFMSIYPSGYKGYKINDTIETRDLKRLANYLLENMEENLTALEVPLEVLPEKTQEDLKYKDYNSIYVKINKFSPTTRYKEWANMIKAGFRF